MAWEALSFAAVLNCEADDEAGQFQKDNIARPRVPMLENTIASLMLNGETVTGHYKAKIRKAASLGEYFDYLKLRFDWNDDILKSVDWEQLKQLMRKHRGNQLILMKHIHGIAPTGTVAHRNNQIHPITCPACDMAHESNNHLMTCLAPARAEWRTNLIRKISLSGIGEVHDPGLLDLLRDGVQRWLSGRPAPPQADYSPQYTPLLIAQNTIGWAQLFRGRWAVQWSQLQQQYMERTNRAQNDKRRSAWVMKVGSILIQSWLDLWKMRVKDRHGKDQAEQLVKQRAHLLAQLEELYTYKEKVLPAHRHLFLGNAAAHLEHTRHLDSLEDWIHAFRPAILSSTKQAQSIAYQLTRTDGG